MSVPSSEGRLSMSSMPSLASSPTLNSRHSGAYADNGEGSSSQRPSRAGSRQHSGARNHGQEEQSRRTRASLHPDAVDETDFARRKRSRRSGGFLLDSAFSSGPPSQHPRQSARGKDSKHSHAHDRSERSERQPTPGNVNSSPLSREVKMADAGATGAESRVDSVNTSHHEATGEFHVARNRPGAPATPSGAHSREQPPDAAIPRPAFDPTQIVHMALSLNESRRRNLSAGQLLTPQAHPTSGRRRDGSINSPSSGSGHLRQYLNEQRRASRNISPLGDRSPGRHMSTSTQRRGSVLIQGQQGNEPAEATWRRVDKARAFFELRIEYLRLLELLPPLKPDSNAPGNFVVTANNVPGSPHAHLTRVPSYANRQHDLGRPYNPLQVLRNRRSRARERKVLEVPPEDFADVEQVRKWVDSVDVAARSAMYRRYDGVALPKFQEGNVTATDPAKSARPSKIWTFSAEELLADAHWLEHGDNKTIVEDRYGRKIFPPREPQKQDLLSARPSKEYSDQRRRSWVEGVAADNHNTTGDESEGLSDRGRKRRLLPTFRAESPKHRKHGWIGSKQQAGSDTDSSDSDSDHEKRRSRKTQKTVGENNETGALKLRMKHLMEREANETQRTEIPLLFTPDTPNKWGPEATDDLDGKGMRSSIEVSDSANGSTRANLAGLKLPPKQRNDPELSKDPSKEYRSSFEEFDSTAPSTPLFPRHYPHLDSDLSPPPSRAGSQKKQKKSKLDFLRSEESRAKHDHDRLVADSAGPDKKRSSRNQSEEPDEGTGIGSAIWAAPGAVKNFLGHRKNDSTSSLTSPIKERERKDMKEPSSAVTRFIKGVKNEGSKMGGFIFRKDGPTDELDTDAMSDRHDALESDTDDDIDSLPKKASALARSPTAETGGSTFSKTYKKTPSYHLELPSFRSQSKIDEDSASDLSDNHISRQSRQTAQNRSPRFDKLAPPGLDLSRISSASSVSSRHDRISQLLARPGGVGHAGPPVTALARGRLPSSSTDVSPKRKSSRPTLEGKRHWSITDSQNDLPRIPSNGIIVSPSEIARVRALFLCSGIKAKEINRRALEVRETPRSYLVRAAKSANVQLYSVRRKEEHVLAARILTTAFETRVEELHKAAQRFREGTVTELQSRISDLKATVETSLFARVRAGGDEALAVSSSVSADAPLAVKQITDDIEHMMRMRRRRTRWVRRVGWTLLEWALLGFMWCAWLVVTLSRVVGRSVGLFWRVVRWLLWL